MIPAAPPELQYRMVNMTAHLTEFKLAQRTQDACKWVAILAGFCPGTESRSRYIWQLTAGVRSRRVCQGEGGTGPGQG